jgi:hypothetical protein
VEEEMLYIGLKMCINFLKPKEINLFLKLYVRINIMVMMMIGRIIIVLRKK